MFRKLLWVLPVVWLITFTIVHYQLNNHYFNLFEEEASGRKFIKGVDSSRGTMQYNQLTGQMEIVPPPGVELDIYEILENDIHRHTGSWTWRFFQWGPLGGNAMTAWTSGMIDLGLPESWAYATDPLNPSPILGFLLLSLFALLGGHRSRVKTTDHSVPT